MPRPGAFRYGLQGQAYSAGAGLGAGTEVGEKVPAGYVYLMVTQSD